jgi:hypothetical protein
VHRALSSATRSGAAAFAALVLAGVVGHGGEARAAAARMVLEPSCRELAKTTATCEVLLRVVGRAPPASPPSLSASLGEIEAPSETKPGQWTALYHPPVERQPAVVVLAARLELDGGPIFAVATVPIVGTMRILIDTEPGATVRLPDGSDVGEEWRADASGRVEIVRRVLPGTREVPVLITDAAGNERRQRVRVDVPYPRLHLVTGSGTAIADGQTPTLIGVVQITAQGRPVPFTGTCATTQGELVRDEVSPEITLWRLVAPAAGPAPAEITCTAGSGAAAGEIAQRSLALVAGRLHTLSFDGPLRCAAGGRVPLPLVARDLAGQERPLPAELVASAAAGAVRREVDSGGSVTWVYEAPRTLAGGDIDRVTVREPSSGVQTQAEINLLPGPPQRLLLSAAEAEPDVAWGEEVLLSLRAVDELGNETPFTEPVEVDAGAGEAVFDPATPATGVVRYRASASAAAERDRVRVSSGGLEVDQPISLHPPWADSRVGARAGVWLLASGRPALAAGADVATALPLFEGDLRLRAGLTLARAQMTSALRYHGERVGRVQQVSWVLPFLLSAELRLVEAGAVELSLGAGGGGAQTWCRTEPQGGAGRVPPPQRLALLSGAVSARLEAGFDLGAGVLDIGLEGVWLATGAAPSVDSNLAALALTLGWHYAWRDTLW